MAATQMVGGFNERTRVVVAGIALVVTFAGGLAAGLSIPRAGAHTASAESRGTVWAAAPVWSAAQAASAYAAYRQGEQAGEAALPAGSAAYQRYRQGERTGTSVP
jgi:murein endopeptidase